MSLAVLTSLGGGALIVLALSRWLGDLWAKRILQDESFTKQRELEELRAALKRVEMEHQVAFHRVFEKQAEAILHLYKLMVAFQSHLGSAKINLDIYDKLKTESSSHFFTEACAHLSDVAAKLSSFYNENKLLFRKELVVKLENVVLAALALSSLAPNVKRIEGAYEPREEVLKVWHTYNLGLPRLIGEIEEEFRAIMRVSSGP